MLGQWRVVAVTPAGRRRYLEVLLPYLLRERGWVDEYQLWVNTRDGHDREYLESVERQHRPFVRLVAGAHVPDGSRTVGAFYPLATEHHTIYVKLDDDICFIGEGALLELVRFRVRHPEFFLVHANAVNSVRASFVHQRRGAIGVASGTVRNHPLCPVGWRSGRFAASTHARFLEAIRERRLERFRFGVLTLRPGERCSINCCAWRGEDFARFDGRIEGDDDEQWLTVERPARLGQASCIVGSALVAHFAYHPQRDYLEQWTGLLGEYRALSEAIPAPAWATDGG